ncbi:hypothetical protein PMAYCL1PPCAC_04523, partial [Pristionchus mayeri]
ANLPHLPSRHLGFCLDDPPRGKISLPEDPSLRDAADGAHAQSPVGLPLLLVLRGLPGEQAAQGDRLLQQGVYPTGVPHHRMQTLTSGTDETRGPHDIRLHFGNKPLLFK